ncbi:hypothetical protein [Lacimicrobium sp. SS2-24]|uniref:hypothetical protein n=1 Tax=Lacimicrobium sp. SS2-24 TaxID=2005569 RepID=UPI000B4C01C7|nr:hypothetical protein [Lacimicrobium sp. SS2-24]
MTIFNEPYPNIGIVLQKIAGLADTSRLAFNNNNKRYRKDEDYGARKTVDAAVLQDSIEQLFLKPLSKTVSDEFGRYFAAYVRLGLSNYIELMKHVPMEAIERKRVVEMLNLHLFVESLASLIWQLGREQMQANDIPAFYFEENPIQTLIRFYETQVCSGGPNFNQYFEENIRTATKWRSGHEIPNIGSLQSIARWATLSSPDAADEDKQALFLCRFIAAFHKKTQYKYVEPLRHAIAFRLKNGTEPQIYLHNLFREFYAQEIQRSDLHDLATFALQLHQELKRSSGKPEGSYKELTEKVNFLNDLMLRHGVEAQLDYHCEWFRGRLAILSGDIENAGDHYANAVEKSLYKAGNNIRDLLKEALAVNAIQKKPYKPTLKKLKNRALTFYPKIIEPKLRNLPVTVTDEDIFEWRLWFIARFPKRGWFKEGIPVLERRVQEMKIRGCDK